MEKKSSTEAKKTNIKRANEFNYYAIYGTTSGSLVKADSHLANELHHTLVQKSANLLSEVVCPRDFELMRGYDGKTEKNNLTDKFSFEFGVKGKFRSKFDNAATTLYRALGKKSKGSSADDLMPEIINYFSNCLLKDEKLVWGSETKR